MQHSDLLGTCAEVASERDKASAESKLLREELNKSVVNTIHTYIDSDQYIPSYLLHIEQDNLYTIYHHLSTQE